MVLFFASMAALLLGYLIYGAVALLLSLTGINLKVLIGIISAYYFLAAILSIATIIGRVSPVSGAILIFMAVATITMLMFQGYEFYPQKTFIQKGTDLVIVENVVQRPYTGHLNPEQPNLVHVQGSYVDDGG